MIKFTKNQITTVSVPEAFVVSEHATDCTFHKLPKTAQDLAIIFISEALCERDLVAMLDASPEFRLATSTPDHELVKEVDDVCRYWKFLNDA